MTAAPILRLAPGATIGSARRVLTRALRDCGCDSPELDARLIVGYALSLDHAGLAANADRILTGSDAAAIDAMGVRRCAREPVARILGNKEFWGLTLRLSPATLIPRPETETVVEAARDAIGKKKSGPLRIADLGTESGAILLALLSECQSAFGVGTDRSVEALATARGNADGLGLRHRTVFIACDYGTALAGGFDLVVSNPPYIATRDIATLAPEVRTHDPPLALDGGHDGFDAYRAIAADAARLVGPDGALILEIGTGQSETIMNLLAVAGFATEPAWPDLAGIPRVLTARRAMPAGQPREAKKTLGLSAKKD